MPCFDDQTIQDLVTGALAPGRRAEVDRHLAECTDCGTLVAEYAKWALPQGEAAPSDPAPRSGPLPLAPGTTLGRYRVVRPIGAGGAGAVYEGYDPQLGRRVAIKVLHLVSPRETPGEAQARLLSEARAMARLAHPAVVGVHDAGVFEGHVYLVMELVDGQTLSAWLREKRPWRTVLRVLLHAGEGLAAAHRAGVVHGDVKPDNLLIGDDARVRVTDFGLALAAGRPEGEATLRSPAGTPAYMAPEVLAGGRPDARSDQYSFALTAHRALLGEPGGTIAPCAQQLGAPPAGPIPSGVARVLRRGLAVRPRERHEGIRPLLRALERAGRDRRMAVATAGVATALAALWVALAAPGTDRPRGFALRCGDGRLDPGEECDDANRVDGDGCTRCLRCPPDRTLATVDGTCYTLVPAADWFGARTACETEGGHLATFPHRNHHAEIVSALRARALPSVWIGLRRESDTLGPLWITGAPVDPSLRHRLPIGGGWGRSGCGAQEEGGPTRRWDMGDCGRSLPAVCTRSPWAVRPATGHAYRVFAPRSAWAEARAACRRIGADLATITDGDEHAFVAGLVSDYVWLGGGDAEREGEFAWVTGEPFRFRAFAAGEAQGGAEGASQDCLTLGADERWHDWRCDLAAYMSMCEVP